LLKVHRPSLQSGAGFRELGTSVVVAETVNDLSSRLLIHWELPTRLAACFRPGAVWLSIPSRFES
jgi:hypothetical protein